MYLAMSKFGISVNYKCHNLKYTVGLFRKKCPDEYSDKCYKCDYCMAELSAYDATKLLNSFGARLSRDGG